MSKVSVWEKVGIDRVCELIREGKSSTEIAAICKTGTTAGWLLEWIARDSGRSARAKEAWRVGSKYWEERAEQILKDAQTPFELTKARDLAHHYRWRAKCLAPREFGDKIDVSGQLDTGKLSGAELDAKLAAALAKVKK